MFVRPRTENVVIVVGVNLQTEERMRNVSKRLIYCNNSNTNNINNANYHRDDENDD